MRIKQITRRKNRFYSLLVTLLSDKLWTRKMSIHYKFKSAIDYDTITFDGLHISVSDLKKSIVQQKRLGKATDFDLMITNAQTNEGETLFLVGVVFGFN